MANRRFQEIPINGSVNSRLQAEAMGPEFSRFCVNWVQEEDGSLRPRTPFLVPTQTGTAIPNGGNSVFYSGSENSNIRGVYVSRRNSGPGNITIHRADDETSPAWGSAVIDTLTGADFTVPFVAGNGVIVYGNWTFPNNRLRFWNGTTTADASTVAIAGRGLAYHKERFWTCGTAANPSRLYYSGIGDHTSWSLDTFIDVGPNDGGVAEDILPANGGLLIAKSNGLWFLSGDGPSSFALTKIDNGEGQWGRCIAVTNYGVVVAGSDEVWLWPGQGPAESLTYDFTDYNASSGPCTLVAVDDWLVINNSIGTIFVYNMRTQTWHTEQSSTVDADQILAMCLGGLENKTIISVAKPGCNSAVDGIQTRTMTGLNRNKDDSNRGALYQYFGGWFHLSDVAHKTTLRHVHVFIAQRNTGTGNLNLSVLGSTSFGGADSIHGGDVVVTPAASSGFRRIRIDCRKDATQYMYQLFFQYSRTAGSTDTQQWDILKVVAEYDEEEPR